MFQLLLLGCSAASREPFSASSPAWSMKFLSWEYYWCVFSYWSTVPLSGCLYPGQCRLPQKTCLKMLLNGDLFQCGSRTCIFGHILVPQRNPFGIFDEATWNFPSAKFCITRGCMTHRIFVGWKRWAFGVKMCRISCGFFRVRKWMMQQADFHLMTDPQCTASWVGEPS